MEVSTAFKIRQGPLKSNGQEVGVWTCHWNVKKNKISKMSPSVFQIPPLPQLSNYIFPSSTIATSFKCFFDSLESQINVE